MGRPKPSCCFLSVWCWGNFECTSLYLETRGFLSMALWKEGIFSVRSAYRMLVVHKERVTPYLENTAGRSDLRSEENERKSFWQVKVPSKIHVLLWRLAHHSLTTGDVLHHRNMATQSTCAICGMPGMSTSSSMHYLLHQKPSTSGVQKNVYKKRRYIRIEYTP